MFNYRLLIWIFLLHLQLLFIDIVNCSYRIPMPTIEISPIRGFNVSIPDTPGITYFEFRGSLKDCSCPFFDYTRAPENGKWTYSHNYTKLGINDTLYYDIIVHYKNVEYQLGDQTFRISDIYDDNNNSDGGDEHQTTATVTVITPTKPNVGNGYIVPVPTFEISPVIGFNASIPDTPGITFFEFRGSLKGCSCPSFLDFIRAPENGKWTYSNNYKKLRINDTIYYDIIVHHKNVEYRLDYQKFRISDIYDDNNNSDGGDEHQTTATVTTTVTPIKSADDGDGCHESITEVFGVKQCQGSLIFEEQFNTFDDDKWQHAIELDSDDYKFATYQNDSEVCNIENGNFIITPKLFVTLPGKNEDSLRGGLDFGRMCTGTNGTEQCIRPASIGSILPPVVSCKIRTKDKFQFKYGRIEIRAILPIGDWMFPELFLDSSRSPSRYYHGQLRIGFIRSNEHLTINGITISGKRLYGGAVLRAKDAAFRKDRYKNKIMENHFGNDYHVYGLTWTDEKISLYVDGEMYGEMMNNEYITNNNNKLSKNEGGSSTPFNREFFISLGVGVGGISDFPDNCLSGNKIKPWVNSDPRNVYRFWNDHDNWYSTWTNDAGDNLAQLKVDYVKVYAI